MTLIALRAEALTDFLNQTPADKKSARVRGIFQLCQSLRALNPAATKQAENLRHSINAHLSAFTVTPLLSGDTWAWKAPHPGREAGASPEFVLGVLADLDSRGLLHRIRQCFCGRWFFAGSEKKLVCTDACRFAKYKLADPETFKAFRADYMREYRRKPAVRKRSKSPR